MRTREPAPAYRGGLSSSIPSYLAIEPDSQASLVFSPQRLCARRIFYFVRMMTSPYGVFGGAPAESAVTPANRPAGTPIRRNPVPPPRA
jgi:hypothetical protein